MNDDAFMREALREAREAASEREVPIGGVVTCGGRIIARAHNYTERLNDVTAHAEMQAITSAASFLGGKYLQDCTLYVTVEPCLMCAGAIGWSQMQRVVYGAADPKRGYHTYCDNPFHKNTKITGGVLEEECAQLMTNFFKKKRKYTP